VWTRPFGRDRILECSHKLARFLGLPSAVRR
jgi:hypothetical protein